MILNLDRAPPRLTIAMLLAVPLVYALFLTASWLVTVDEVSLPAVAERPLTTITPQSESVIAETVIRPLTLTTAQQPAPPPRPAIETTGSAPTYTFAPPSADSLGLMKITPPTVVVSALAGRNIQVVRAPAPSIPNAAMTRGLSGSCNVLFDVDVRGRPFNLSAQCTDTVFEAEAIRAVSRAEFLPKINAQGIAAEQHGAIYPIEFKVQ